MRAAGLVLLNSAWVPAGTSGAPGGCGLKEGSVLRKVSIQTSRASSAIRKVNPSLSLSPFPPPSLPHFLPFPPLTAHFYSGRCSVLAVHTQGKGLLCNVEFDYERLVIMTNP